MAFVPALSVNASFRYRCTPLKNVNRCRPDNRAVTRMIAAEPIVETSTKTELSDHALTLNSYIRGHKFVFQPGDGFSATTSNLFKKNDTARVFTPLDELETNDLHLPGRAVAAVMVSQKDALIDLALSAAEDHLPTARSDETMSDILSYNIDTLLRAISYGAACQSSDFLHLNNVGIMKLLHEDVSISHATISAALSAVKKYVLAHVSEVADDASVVESTAECFDIVIDALA